MTYQKLARMSVKEVAGTAAKPFKKYWGNLSGKTYNAARSAAEKASEAHADFSTGPLKMFNTKPVEEAHGRVLTNLIGDSNKAKKTRDLVRAGTGGAAAAAAGGIALKNSQKKEASFSPLTITALLNASMGKTAAENIGPYGNEEQSQAALDAVGRGARRGALVGGGVGAVGGGLGGALIGGMTGSGAKPMLRGAAGGAVIGMLTNAAYGAYKGGINAEKALPVQPPAEKTASHKKTAFLGTAASILLNREAASSLSPEESRALAAYHGHPGENAMGRATTRGIAYGLLGDAIVPGVGGALAGYVASGKYTKKKYDELVAAGEITPKQETPPAEKTASPISIISELAKAAKR